MASAKPSSVLELVTNLAACCTSELAFPIAMLTPLRLNMNTSFGMSPMVAIFAVGTFSISARTLTASPLFAFG